MPDVRVVGPKIAGDEKILTPEALNFVEKLYRNFSGRRTELLKKRKIRQKEIDRGVLPKFIDDTVWIRKGDWKVDPAPADLQDRRVEITGPASSRKMVINALNSGASCYMADAEDSESPTWDNIINGQINLYDAVRRQIDFTDEKTGKQYKLNDKTAVLFFRPRGWHLEEKHVLLGETPVPASLFDFGMYFYHNAKALLEKGTGVYLYLPKLESRHEARLWNDVFDFAETWFRIPTGSIRATVLIETILAAFEMDEILYELRHHSAGLNAGRWDYIFSVIKTFAKNPKFILPDCDSLKMDKGFLASYCNLLVQTCHKRDAYAMGGMSSHSPSKDDEAVNQNNSLGVKGDAAREVKLGFDGKWVSHPVYVSDAKEIFDIGMPTPNQLHVLREEVNVTAKDLLRVPEGERTESGLRHNVRVELQYWAAWLSAVGCVQLYYKMEDVATAVMRGVQNWQWRFHQAELSNGQRVTNEFMDRIITEEAAKLKGAKLALAEKLVREALFADECPEFLTLAAYDHIISISNLKGGSDVPG